MLNETEVFYAFNYISNIQIYDGPTDLHGVRLYVLETNQMFCPLTCSYKDLAKCLKLKKGNGKSCT